MSIVCCRVTEDKIEMASDSILVRGWTQNKSNDKFAKMSEVNGMIIGGVGFAEETSLFQIFCETRKPGAATESSLVNFISEFADWKNSKMERYKIENEYIIVVENKAFYIQSFFVKEIMAYEAIGAGMDFALAALYFGKSVPEAVSAACELSVYCEKPINFIERKWGK